MTEHDSRAALPRLQLEGDSATIEASDQGQVTVKLSQVSRDLSVAGCGGQLIRRGSVQEANFSEAYVEVIGKVGNDLTVQEYTRSVPASFCTRHMPIRASLRSVNMGDNIGQPGVR